MIHWNFAVALIYDVTLAAISIAAIRAGESEERIGAAIMIAASGATDIALPLALWLGVPSRLLRTGFNVGALIACDVLMSRSRKFWPIWMVGAQLAELSMDFVMLTIPIEGRPYGLLRGKFAYVQLLALLLGTWRSARRRRRQADNDITLIG